MDEAESEVRTDSGLFAGDEKRLSTENGTDGMKNCGERTLQGEQSKGANTGTCAHAANPRTTKRREIVKQ